MMMHGLTNPKFKGFSFLESIQTGHETYPTFYSTVIGGFLLRGKEAGSVKLPTVVHLIPR
jgi:hypothetical protein